MSDKAKALIFLAGFGTICGFIGSTIRAAISRKGIIKVMDYYENECKKIEDPVKREEEWHKANSMISWCIRKVLWGPNSN